MIHLLRSKNRLKATKLQKLQQSTGATMKQRQNNNKTTAEHNTTCITTPINKQVPHRNTNSIDFSKDERVQNRQQPTGGTTIQQQETTKMKPEASINEKQQKQMELENDNV
jgi:hypothetical protein